jgi:hypothetical protein
MHDAYWEEFMKLSIVRLTFIVLKFDSNPNRTDHQVHKSEVNKMMQNHFQNVYVRFKTLIEYTW